MQINNQTTLSILILQELEQAEDPLPPKELARRLSVSPDYVSDVVAALRRAGYIKSFASSTTGCRRVKSAKEIPLPEFLQRLEGLLPDYLDDPVDVQMVREKARGLVKGTVADCFTKKVRTRPPRETSNTLTIRQVQEMLGICRSYIYLMISEGRLPPPQMVNHRCMWPRDVVENVARKRQEHQAARAQSICKDCGRDVIPYLIRLQMTRMQVRGYPKDIIQKVMPRCYPCTTRWMRAHQGLRRPR